MRALVQRVSEASVEIGGETAGSIGQGLAILLGVAPSDSQEDVAYLAEKCANLRIFTDSEDKMNLSLLDVKGEALVVSQFTLYGDCRRGRRPSFSDAALPAIAEPLYESFVKELSSCGVKVATGRFAADMLVKIHNDGPVTLIVESK